jgi:hypothetical protein
MANIGKWSLSGVGLTTIFSAGTTAIDSVTTGTMTFSSATYANQTNLDLYVDVEVTLNTLSPTAGAYVALYALESVDGTNFPAQSGADMRLTSTQLMCVIPIGTTASTAQRVVARNILLPPAVLKFAFDNQTGATTNASGNTVKILPYSYNLNG